MAIVLPKFSRRRLSSGFASETQPALNVRLCREEGAYEAGGMLAANWRVSRVPLNRLQNLEVSVMWHTEGKGDEDLHVHHFHRFGPAQLQQIGLIQEQSLRCQLPMTPLSYRGRLITICWCIRLRLFMTDGREIVAEQPFHLVAAGPVERRARPVEKHRFAESDHSPEGQVAFQRNRSTPLPQSFVQNRSPARTDASIPNSSPTTTSVPAIDPSHSLAEVSGS